MTTDYKTVETKYFLSYEFSSGGYAVMLKEAYYQPLPRPTFESFARYMGFILHDPPTEVHDEAPNGDGIRFNETRFEYEKIGK